jgi:hypothetical protein
MKIMRVLELLCFISINSFAAQPAFTIGGVEPKGLFQSLAENLHLTPQKDYFLWVEDNTATTGLKMHEFYLVKAKTYQEAIQASDCRLSIVTVGKKATGENVVIQISKNQVCRPFFAGIFKTLLPDNHSNWETIYDEIMKVDFSSEPEGMTPSKVSFEKSLPGHSVVVNKTEFAGKPVKIIRIEGFK